MQFPDTFQAFKILRILPYLIYVWIQAKYLLYKIITSSFNRIVACWNFCGKLLNNLAETRQKIQKHLFALFLKTQYANIKTKPNVLKNNKYILY